MSYHIPFNFGLTGVFVFRSSSSLRFGRGSGAISLGYMNCVGTETSIQSCLSSSNLQYCSHNDDVGVGCDRIDSSGECCILQLIKVCVHVNNKESCNLRLAMISRKV